MGVTGLYTEIFATMDLVIYDTLNFTNIIAAPYRMWYLALWPSIHLRARPIAKTNTDIVAAKIAIIVRIKPATELALSTKGFTDVAKALIAIRNAIRFWLPFNSCMIVCDVASLLKSCGLKCTKRAILLKIGNASTVDVQEYFVDMELVS